MIGRKQNDKRECRQTKQNQSIREQPTMVRSCLRNCEENCVRFSVSLNELSVNAYTSTHIY